MRILRESKLTEYAEQFWNRQRAKPSPDDLTALEDIRTSGDCIGWLVDLYPYKLPHLYNSTMSVVLVESVSDVERFLIHKYMLTDEWTTERCLVPCPKSRRLGDLVRTALQQNYFESNWPDTQCKLFQEWKGRSSLEGFIENIERPLIESTWVNEHEIVDGWGRLHALLALVRAGLRFAPFECFLASR